MQSDLLVEPVDKTTVASDTGELGSHGPPRAVVVGLGLIGTSIGLALRLAGWHVSGVDIDQTRSQRAKELGALDHIGADELAEVAFVATPVGSVVEVVRSLLTARGLADSAGKHSQTPNSPLRPPLVVTDVAGVKAEIVSSVEYPHFVGGHPMAGSEQVGPDGATADLFKGATWVLTPTVVTDEQAYSRIRSIVATFGAEVVALEPNHHDQLVAMVSHVPHLVAVSLMGLAAEAAESERALLRLAAGGFRDMTRIAAGDPAIWPDILISNDVAILAVLDSVLERLGVVRDLVVERDTDGLSQLLSSAQLARRNLPIGAPAQGKVVDLCLAVTDQPGVLATITTVLGRLAINVFDLEISHSIEGGHGVLSITVDQADADRAELAMVSQGYHPSRRVRP